MPPTVVVQLIAFGHVGFQRENIESAVFCQIADDPVLHFEHFARSVRILSEPDHFAVSDQLPENVEVLRVPAVRLAGPQRIDVSAQLFFLPVGQFRFRCRNRFVFVSYAVDSEFDIVEPRSTLAGNEADNQDIRDILVDRLPDGMACPLGHAANPSIRPKRSGSYFSGL